MAVWKDIIGPLKNTQEFKKVTEFVKNRRAQGITVLPDKKDVFNAFAYTPFDKLKVVIIGQDPYQTPGFAMGLSFSVRTGVSIPKSLQNIYKELETDIPGFQIPLHGNLIPWARQGVLLLNSVLTVDAGVSNSHQDQGWEFFTDKVIDAISEKCENVVFMLWGSYAQLKGSRIDNSRHLVLKAAHPSPLSAYKGFFGCHHFSLANSYLEEHKKKPIDWRLPLVLQGDEEL
ncbi:MAG: uracil-DNA glycosylase [Succinivibrio sp.]